MSRRDPPLIRAVFLASVVSATVGGGGVHAGTTVAGSAAPGAGQLAAPARSGTPADDVDSLFRWDHPDATGNPQVPNAQSSGILATKNAGGDVSAPDRGYLARKVAARTGVTRYEAKKRVYDVIAREKVAVVKVKQEAYAGARFAIFTALEMLVGAFVASAAAAFGSDLRASILD